MIWLSPTYGAEETNVYFEIRDIALQPNGQGGDGLVRGLLGDGQQEIWAEVQLGANAEARILPCWSEDGRIETLRAEVDEGLLKEQLLDAVEKLFSTVNSWSVMPHVGKAEPRKQDVLVQSQLPV